MEFQFQQILHLGKTEVFLSIADTTVARELDIGPLAQKSPERQGRNLAFDGLADVAPGRIKGGQKAIKA